MGWKADLTVISLLPSLLSFLPPSFLHFRPFFHKYLLTAHYMSVTVIGTGNISVRETKFLTLENLPSY